MKLKDVLGFCCYKGCKNKSDFNIEVKIGEKKEKAKLCNKHTAELMRSGGLDHE